MRISVSSLALPAPWRLHRRHGAIRRSIKLTIAAREYNQDVRWGRFDKAAKHVPTDVRQRFIDKHANLEDDLEIADFEMSGIEVDKNKKTATARIDYTWSLKRRGIVEKTTTKQKWEEPRQRLGPRLRRARQGRAAGPLRRTERADKSARRQVGPRPVFARARARIDARRVAPSAYNYAGLNLANDSLDFVQRGKVSIVRRQYAEAVKICRLGLLGQPSLLEGRLVLGMALTALGRWDEVLAEMRVALETDPNAALAWLLKGEALVGKGDYLQAEQTLKRAKELDPSNSKADQLLAEIATARAAGFEGLPAEPTDTKVYPARVTGNTDPELGNVVQPMPMDRGQLVVVPDSEEVSVAVRGRRDRGRSRSVRSRADHQQGGGQAGVGAGRLRRRRGHRRGFADRHRDVPQAGRQYTRTEDSSYEGPATEDYGERARPRVASITGPTIAGKKPGGGGDFATDEPSEDSTMTPAEILRARKPTVQRRAVDELPLDGMEPSEPSIILETKDLQFTDQQSREGFPRGFAPTFDTEDGEDEQTRQRRQRQVDEHAGTAPEAPEPVLQRQRPVRPFDPLPRGPQPTFPRDSSEAPTEMRGENGSRSVYGDGDGHESPYGAGEDMPGVVRVPVARRKPRTTLFVRGVDVPWLGDRSRRGIALLLTALIAVVAVGVATGLLVREWRMRARVAKRHELAQSEAGVGQLSRVQDGRSACIGRSWPSATIPRRARSGRACWRRWRSSSAIRPSWRSGRSPRSATTRLRRAPTRSPAARTSPRRASIWRWPRASSIAPRGWRRRCDVASPTRRRRIS